MTADQVLAAYHALSAGDRRLVEAALAEDLRRRLDHYERCRAARSDRVERRNQAVHALIDRHKLPVTGRGAWPRILALLSLHHAELALVHRPPGPLDSLSVHWIQAHTIAPRQLRHSYLGWLKAVSATDADA